MLKGIIRKNINTAGMTGFLSSFIYFSYSGGIKKGFEQAYNRQGFDLIHGTDTQEISILEVRDRDELANDEYTKLAVDSVSDKVERVHAALEFLIENGVIPGESNFIDFGCGKGRSLIIASKMGFKKLFGVELSPTILAICKSNLEKVGVNNANLIQNNFRKVDYSSLAFESKPVVIYAYNPTAFVILRESCLKLLSECPDIPVFCIYTNPQDKIEFGQLLFHDKKTDVYRLQ
jgi:SAM-dependent methyltransferase